MLEQLVGVAAAPFVIKVNGEDVSMPSGSRFFIDLYPIDDGHDNWWLPVDSKKFPRVMRLRIARRRHVRR